VPDQPVKRSNSRPRLWNAKRVKQRAKQVTPKSQSLLRPLGPIFPFKTQRRSEFLRLARELPQEMVIEKQNMASMAARPARRLSHENNISIKAFAPDP